MPSFIREVENVSVAVQKQSRPDAKPETPKDATYTVEDCIAHLAQQGDGLSRACLGYLIQFMKLRGKADEVKKEEPTAEQSAQV